MAKVFNFVVSDLVRILDGDTQEVVLDMGFNFAYRATVRLNGTDAPENHGTTKDASAVVIAVVAKWFEARKGALTLLSKELDKYGRVLGDFIPHTGNKDLDAETLAEYLLSRKLVRAYNGEKKPDWLPAQLALIRAFKP